MATDDEIRQIVDRLLDSLAEREKQSWKLGIAIGVLVFAGIGILLHSRGELWVNALGASMIPGLAAGAGVWWGVILPAEKRVRESYIAAFSSNEARLVADRILGEIPAQVRRLDILSRFRRKLGVILRRFRCHACSARVNVEHLGQVVRCPRCKVELLVPRNPPCPSCGERNTRVISPEEQVAPTRTGGAAGAGGLIYGPVGLIAGGILNAMYLPFKLASRDFRMATKAHLFYCNKCLHTWAVTLRPVASER